MRWKLFLSYMVIIVVAVASLGLIVRSGTAREVRAYMLGGGMVDAQQLQAELEHYYAATGSWQGVDQLLVGSSHMGGMGPGGMGGMGGMLSQRLRIADAQGDVLADTGGISGGAFPAGSLTASEKNNGLVLRLNGETIGYLVMQGGMGFGAQDERTLLARLDRAALLAGLAAGGVALLLALLLAYTLLRPVRELTEAAGKLAAGGLNQRVPVRGKDELALLGQTFNQMTSSLEQAEESRRAMTADIAHELRTPLSVQRADLEALQDGIFPLTIESLQPILEQNLLLTRLVEDLRTLAMVDAGQLGLELTQADFPALVGRMVERFTPQAAALGVTIQLKSVPDNLPLLNLDPMRIEQILNNLLSNALRYTPSGGKIDLMIQSSGKLVTLRVQDSGPGIPPDQLGTIFDRFYRLDRSRTRTEGGSGLGLAIARQLARAHHGELSAENAAQGGAVFILSLPV